MQMALNVHEVAALRERIAGALLNDRISAFERQFLEMHEARLEQHGTHAMLTEGQRIRLDTIFGNSNRGSGLHQEQKLQFPQSD
jgi:hypothetical protein